MTEPNHQPSAHRAQTPRHAVPAINHSRNSPRPSRRRRYNSDDWERRKPELENLYKKENRTLRETIEEMEKQGFYADKNAYKRYFKQWNWTKNRTRQVGPTPTTQVPNRMGDPPTPASTSMRATTSNPPSQHSKELQENRPFFLFREHRNINNPIFLAQAAVLSVHLQDHMDLAPDQVRRMLADFGPPQSQRSSDGRADSSFFFGVLGLLSNKALSNERIGRFLDIIMVERFAPKTFLELIFTIATPTVDAISETLLGHRYIPKPLGLLLGVGVSRRHLTGDRPWKMFCSAFHAKALDPETGKKLLSEFWEPSMKPDIGLTTWWPSLDTKRDPIAQDSDLMDRLVDIGAISLHQAMSHAVRWNQVSRVTLLLGRGADTNRCRIYASTDMARPHISALDCAYVKCFTKVYQLLVQRNGSTTPDHPTIHEILTTANLGIRSLFAYLESNHSLAASFTFALHIAVLYHQEHLDDAIDVLLACGVSLSADYLSYHAIKPTLANAIPNIDLVGRLLRVGASINHPSVITTASSDSNHFACLRFLVARGINLAKVGSIGLSVALENGNERGFEFLLHAGADVNGKPDPTPELWIPPLSMAAKKGDVKAARTMLYRGANVDIENERRWRPIHYAARFADLRMVKLLVQFGADLGDPKDADVDEWYLSVIESCALRTIPYYSDDPDLLGDLIDRLWSNEDTEIFKYLIEMGAELNSAYVGGSDILRRNPVVANLIRSSAENSVVRFALCMGARFDGRFDPEVTTFATMTPLQAAAKKGNLEMVKELHARGADVNAEPSPYQGATALEAACDGEYDVENRLAVVEYLLDHGADVDADMADGCKRARIVSAAASRGYVEIMIRLLVRGASVKPEILTGQTPLYYAAWDGRLDAVQVLVNTIGSIRYPEQPDYKEEIRIAEKVGHWAIADLLRQARYEPPSESDSE